MREVARAFALQLQTMVRAHPEQWCLLAALSRWSEPVADAGRAA